MSSWSWLCCCFGVFGLGVGWVVVWCDGVVGEVDSFCLKCVVLEVCIFVCGRSGRCCKHLSHCTLTVVIVCTNVPQAQFTKQREESEEEIVRVTWSNLLC